jgi:uncharacterized protein (DUF305 family)
MHFGALVMFVGMAAIHLFVMPFVMLESPSHFRLAVNQVYMAVAAAAAMVIALHTLTANEMIGYGILFVGAVIAIRRQIGVSDTQYLRDLIPHHSMAILTSRRAIARTKDPMIAALAGKILSAQEREIAEMEEFLRPMNI